MTIDISKLKPAEGAGRMTPEALLSAPWRHFGDRVLLGAAFLDEAARQGQWDHRWRWVITTGQDVLDMQLSNSCVLGLTSAEGSYVDAHQRLGFDWVTDRITPEEPFRLGFLTCAFGCGDGESCDPAAVAYLGDPDRDPIITAPGALGQAWIMYCEATVQ